MSDSADEQARDDTEAYSQPDLVASDGRIVSHDADGLPRGMFTTVRHTVEPQADGGYRIDRRREPLDGLQVYRPNLGLVEAAIYAEANVGHGLSIKRQSPPPLPVPEPQAVGQLLDRPPTPHVMQAIHEHPRLLIRHSQGVSPAHLIAEITHTMPGIRMAVCCPHYHQRRAIMDKLRDLRVRFHLATAQRRPDWNRSVVVCSLAGAAQHAVELHRRHLLIFPKATDAIAGEAEIMLTATDARFRVVGFHRDDQRLSPRARDLLAAVYGFTRVDVPVHGYQRRLIEMATLNFRSSTVECGHSIVTTKRQAVWRHDARNLFIVRLAKAIAVGDISRLVDRFPDLCGQVVNLEGRHVVVMVDSVEHAAELARVVKSWPIFTAGPIDLEGLGASACRCIQMGTTQPIDRNKAICTLDGLDDVDLTDGTVLLDARAASHPLPLKTRHIRCPSGSDEQLLLIDVRDHHHPTLVQWATQRRAAYHQAEWVPAGAKQPEAQIKRLRVERFLNEQRS